VLPSLDAATETIYRQVNRPHDSLEFARIVEGLKAFCKEYRGRVWLEVMLINKINDDPQHIEMLKRIIDYTAVEKVQLNTVVRPPAEKTALPVAGTELLSISRLFGHRCEVIAGKGQKQAARAGGEDWQESVLAMLKRRSLSIDDIVSATGVSASIARAGMKGLTEERKVRAVTLGRRRFYVATGNEGL
jgi:wyosine [tRNA(Phe)-imidazoG37] synthetase (radical SAM superfamily)